MVFSVPGLKKRFFFFRLTLRPPLRKPREKTRWRLGNVPRENPHPHFLEIIITIMRQGARGWVFSIYPSIFTNPPSSLYSSSVSISVSSRPYASLLYPPPHYQKTRTQEKKTRLLKLEKKSANHFFKPFFRRVEEFLESRLAQNSLAVGTWLCQGDFIVAIYSHIHKRISTQIFLTQF